MRAFLFFLLFSPSLLAAQTDITSGATQSTFYDAMTIEELIEAIESAKGVASISTQNPNGIPNVAGFIPYIVDNQTIMLEIESLKTTKLNLINRHYGMMFFIIVNPTAVSFKKKYKGARVLLRYISDKKQIEKLRQKTEQASEYSLFLEILKIYPLA